VRKRLVRDGMFASGSCIDACVRRRTELQMASDILYARIASIEASARSMTGGVQ
jgi:xylose isomerase